MTRGEDRRRRSGLAAESGIGAVLRYGRLQRLQRLREVGGVGVVEGVEGVEGYETRRLSRGRPLVVLTTDDFELQSR